MAALAIEQVNGHKPVTTRHARWVRCNRARGRGDRARGTRRRIVDEKQRRLGIGPNLRLVTMERVETAENSKEVRVLKPRVLPTRQYRNCAASWEEHRRREDLRELDLWSFQHRLQMLQGVIRLLEDSLAAMPRPSTVGMLLLVQARVDLRRHLGLDFAPAVA